MNKNLMEGLVKMTEMCKIKWEYSTFGYFYFVMDEDRIELRTRETSWFGFITTEYILYFGKESHYRGWYAGRKLNMAIEQQRRASLALRIEAAMGVAGKAILEMNAASTMTTEEFGQSITSEEE